MIALPVQSWDCRSVWLGHLALCPGQGKAARVVTLRPFSLPILWLCCFSDNKLLWKGPHCFSLPCPNWKNLKDGNQGVIGTSEPPMSALGVCPELTPPSGCFRPEQSAPLISVKGLVDPVGSDLDRSRIRWLLPSSLGGQVHFWHSPAEITHTDSSFASNYSWPYFDPISLKIEDKVKPLVPLVNQNSEFSSCGLTDFMFTELHQW